VSNRVASGDRDRSLEVSCAYDAYEVKKLFTDLREIKIVSDQRIEQQILHFVEVAVVASEKGNGQKQSYSQIS
jgi:hypothetical protein